MDLWDRDTTLLLDKLDHVVLTFHNAFCCVKRVFFL